MPGDIKLGIALDQTKFIKRSISEVEETLIVSTDPGGADHLPVLPQLVDRLPPVDRHSGFP